MPAVGVTDKKKKVCSAFTIYAQGLIILDLTREEQLSNEGLYFPHKFQGQQL